VSIFIDKHTKLVVQGITGRDGSFHTRQMIEYGTQVVAGVTPGKGGQQFDESVPIFNTVHDAVAATGANASIVYVPARFAADAVFEAADAGAELVVCISEGLPVASVLSLYHKQVVMPYWGGGTWDARRLRANDVLYYNLMNHARERGCQWLDFGRSKIGTGAYSFKKNWGFEPQPLTYATRTADGQEARDVNPMSPKYRAQVALWQRLPLSVANRIGPMIAKGLG